MPPIPPFTEKELEDSMVCEASQTEIVVSPLPAPPPSDTIMSSPTLMSPPPAHHPFPVSPVEETAFEEPTDDFAKSGVWACLEVGRRSNTLTANETLEEEEEGGEGEEEEDACEGEEGEGEENACDPCEEGTPSVEEMEEEEHHSEGEGVDHNCEEGLDDLMVCGKAVDMNIEEALQQFLQQKVFRSRELCFRVTNSSLSTGGSCARSVQK